MAGLEVVVKKIQVWFRPDQVATLLRCLDVTRHNVFGKKTMDDEWVGLARGIARDQLDDIKSLIGDAQAKAGNQG